jgi:hypothetical protein
MSQPKITYALIANDDLECLGSFPTSNKKMKVLLTETIGPKLAADDHKRKLTSAQ